MQVSQLKTLSTPNLNDVLPILDIDGGVSGKPILRKVALSSLLELTQNNNDVDLTILVNRVTALETTNTLQDNSIASFQSLFNTISTLATESSLSTLASRVMEVEGVNTSQATSITNLNDRIFNLEINSLPPWKLINVNYSASIGERLMIDSSLGTLTITLPSNPAVGQEVEVTNIRGTGININPNGNKFLGNVLLRASFRTLKTPCKFIYESSGNGWFATNSDALSFKTYELEVTDDTLWVYFRLNESSGTTVVDSSGNSRNGTYQGGITLQQSGGLSYSNNKATAFNGTTGYISFPSAITPNNTFTYECMFKTSSPSGSLFGFSNQQLTGGGSFIRDLFLTGGKLRLYTYNGSVINLDTPLTYNDNKWHIVTVTRSSAGTKIFIDASLVASNTVTSDNTFSGYFHIGYSVSGGFFNGLIDEISICNGNTPTDTKVIQRHLSALV